MEHLLRCNSLKCRKELGDKALVTTCSHIFCTDCATRLGLTNLSGRHSSCPACSSPLDDPDDAVVTNLNPSEEYKTSVLSGLSPSIIIECTSRALSFWAYQTVQEVVYQKYLGKTLTEKYTNLTVHLEKVINDANAQITALNSKISDLGLDQQNLRRKNDELAQAFKEKNKKLMQTQELYDKLKRKAMMGQMQYAAEDAVGAGLHSVPSLDAGDPGRNENLKPSGSYREIDATYQQPHKHQSHVHNVSNMCATQRSNQYDPGVWDKEMASTEVPVTPSTHRQRYGGITGIGLSTIPGFVAGTHSPRHTTSRRAYPNDTSSISSSTGRFPAVGLSSGLKTSHNSGGFNEFAAPASRPQAIQRLDPVASGVARGQPGHRLGTMLDDVRSTPIAGGMRSGFTSR